MKYRIRSYPFWEYLDRHYEFGNDCLWRHKHRHDEYRRSDWYGFYEYWRDTLWDNEYRHHVLRSYQHWEYLYRFRVRATSMK